MTILHPLDDFLFELFPEAKHAGKSLEKLQEAMKSYYTVGPYTPTVTVKDQHIEVEIDTDLIAGQQKDYQEIVRLSEAGKYAAAKQKLLPLLEKAPHISEYHRILGQILSEQGDQEEAVNALIDALRWDPKNSYALLMIGNIFARYQKDMDTALLYYEQATKANPEDNITLNNIGALLVQAGRTKEGIDHLLSAKDLDPDYPNTYVALAMAEEKLGNLPGAFGYTITSVKKARKGQLYAQSVTYAIDLAGKLVLEEKGRSLVSRYTRELEERTGKRIDAVEDDTIATAAKIEFAENYDRDRHIIRYKPSYPAVQHLVMHELVHLDLVTVARQVQKNQLFTTSPAHSKAFDRDMEQDAKRLRKQGLTEDAVKGFLSSIFNGLNLQVYNTPIDLFIEDFLYSTYRELRPYQFLSLLRMVQEGAKATTDKTIVAHAPKAVVSASKVYNLVSALHLMTEMAKRGFTAHYATGSKAFTETLRTIFGRKSEKVFKYFNNYTDAERDSIDVLICDEAHRIRESSYSRFTAKKTDKKVPQLYELLKAGKVVVLFIDDNQIVRPGEIGSIAYVKQYAQSKNVEVVEYELESQFRCNGSDGFVNWLNNTLSIKRTANVIWSEADEETFDFRIFPSPERLEQAIMEKAAEGFSARLTAGFCWPWSEPDAKGNLVPDVQVGSFSRPWNAKPGVRKLANGVPAASLWAYNPNGMGQVGCVYTAQGFEFDYVGVIVGEDLRYDLEQAVWIGDPTRSHDTTVKRDKARFVDYIKNTYKVLMTLGMKGCYVYFMDRDTERFFRSRMERP